MQLEIIIITVITILFYIPYAALHGHFAKQQQYSAPKGKTKIEIGYSSKKIKLYKGLWHRDGLYTRVVVHLIIIYAATRFRYDLETLLLSGVTAAIGISIYSVLIDYWRGLPCFKINATCEDWGKIKDWDCKVLRFLEKTGINLKILMLVLTVLYIAALMIFF